ncbi:MAG: phenylalanine--tRNA ligase subunit beta [Verrucomicrobia bacterium]|nr:phenylalanine--tRNA ligase subunit beta [Verrucomicrobiota bacterium]
MKLSLSWLKEFLDLKISPEEIAEALTLAGLEAEGIEEKEDDLIFEIGLTPNLGHCMSIIGIARELSAILQIPLKRQELVFQESEEKIDVKLKVEDPEKCLRYSCRLVKNVQVGPSPEWLKKRLENSGIRSINNVVDVGNYVMLECGHPLHMFDYDQVDGKTIIVKTGNGTLQTLDEQMREIPAEALLICDQKKPLAFAGVMGGLSSAITEKTKNVLIEAAQFTPQSVRKSCKQLNLRTDSSLRFERGIDPLFVSGALDLAAKLLGGDICQGTIEFVAENYVPTIITLNTDRTNQLLGTQLSLREMAMLLGRLEIQVMSETSHTLKVQIPSYRNDLKTEIDLVEEVGRMYGFNNIARPVPRHASSTLTHAPVFVFEEEVRNKLVAQGLQECLTCDLISPKLAKLAVEKTLGTDHQIPVLHPASVDQSILRTSLLPGLLEVIKFNLDRQNLHIAAFEVGHIHFKDGGNYLDEPAAGIILTGNSEPYHFEKKPPQVDFYDLKGYVENLLRSIGIEETIFEQSHLQNFHPGRQARVKVGDVTVGALGEVHPEHLRILDIDQRVYYAEVNLHDLLKLKKMEHQAVKISPFPGSERDWTVTLDEKMAIGKVLSEMRAFPSKLLENVFLLDLYKSDKIGKDRKNATFRIQYRDPNKTIEYQVVEDEHQRLLQFIAKKLAIV